LIASSWNTLEGVKLLVAVLTPLLVAVVGFRLNRSVRGLEDAQWANRRLVERRLELYDEMAPRLNDLYAFFHLIGRFREIEPPGAIALKHELDRLFHVNRFLFDPAFERYYETFLRRCFTTYTGTGEFAKIRSPIVLQREERRHAQWKSEWESLFDPRIQPPYQDDGNRSLEAAYRVQYDLLLPGLESAYMALMAFFAEEVGVNARAGSSPESTPSEAVSHPSTTAAPTGSAHTHT
jgi:hypothetical protein